MSEYHRNPERETTWVKCAVAACHNTVPTKSRRHLVICPVCRAEFARLRAESAYTKAREAAGEPAKRYYHEGWNPESVEQVAWMGNVAAVIGTAAFYSDGWGNAAEYRVLCAANRCWHGNVPRDEK